MVQLQTSQGQTTLNNVQIVQQMVAANGEIQNVPVSDFIFYRNNCVKKYINIKYIICLDNDTAVRKSTNLMKIIVFHHELIKLNFFMLKEDDSLI